MRPNFGRDIPRIPRHVIDQQSSERPRRYGTTGSGRSVAVAQPQRAGQAGLRCMRRSAASVANDRHQRQHNGAATTVINMLGNKSSGHVSSDLELCCREFMISIFISCILWALGFPVSCKRAFHSHQGPLLAAEGSVCVKGTRKCCR